VTPPTPDSAPHDPLKGRDLSALRRGLSCDARFCSGFSLLIALSIVGDGVREEFLILN